MNNARIYKLMFSLRVKKFLVQVPMKHRITRVDVDLIKLSQLMNLSITKLLKLLHKPKIIIFNNFFL